MSALGPGGLKARDAGDSGVGGDVVGLVVVDEVLPGGEGGRAGVLPGVGAAGD